MSGYPKRPQYYANRVIRMMQKTCAANTIGMEACWLVTCVVHVEDAIHYTGPVSFWNQQLMLVAGFKSWGRLDRARKAAVEAGWLIYRPGKIRGSGTYWANIPEHAASLNDSPIDETHDHYCGAHGGDDHKNGAHDGDEAVTGRSADGEPSNPVPNPIPISPDSFDRFWNAYAKKLGRQDCEQKFRKAVQSVADEKNITPDEAVDFIVERAAGFAARFAADNQFQMYPLKWLKGSRWNDELPNEANGDFETVRATVLRVYSPDIRNAADVESALTPAQYRAVTSVGLDRIASSRGHSNGLATEYAAALGARS